jgi:6-phospho-beta-glucosidase
MKKGIKIVTIGGGSSYTPEIVEGFINRYHELPVKELWLVDIEDGKEKLEIVGNLARRMVKEAGIDCEIHLTLNRREALKGADFVTTQFRVGLLEARIRDERIPLERGMMGQETNGAGGFAKAIRTIPVILDICKDMEELCPDAWLINFTNPSGMVTEAVIKNSSIKTVGLCNVPVNMDMAVAEVLGMERGSYIFSAAGLNHFVWGRHIWHEGKDRMPELIKKMLTSEDKFTPSNIPAYPWLEEQIESLGMMPCSYHRYYYITEELLGNEIEELNTVGTRGEVVKRLEDELFELYKDPNLKEKPKQLEERGGQYYSDAACELINSIYNDKRSLMIVNTKNNGTINSLPDNCAIECTCMIGSAGPVPLNQEAFPTSARGLLQLMKSYEELTIEAAITGNFGIALEAFITNPLITSGATAKEILEEIIKQNIEYLPQFKEYYNQNLS